MVPKKILVKFFIYCLSINYYMYVNFECSMDRWHRKVALVTGAASGIGAAIVSRLIDAGIDVIGLDLQIDLLQEHQKLYQSKDGGNLYPLRCDVTIDDDLENAFAWAVKFLGLPQIVVNNAGITNYTPVIGQNN